MKTLQPIKPKNSKIIEKEIIKVLYDTIFRDLLEEPIEYHNAVDDDLIRAIKSGKIQHTEGKFVGSFNSKISKLLRDMGATFKRGAWNIDLNLLSGNIKQTIAQTNERYEKLKERILQKLSKINIDKMLKATLFKPMYEETITSLDNQWRTAVRTFSIVPELTPEIQSKLAEEYADNLKLYIKNFTAEETVKLRELIQKNTFMGGRAANLEQIIQDRFNVTKSKARFLARQETALLTSKFQELRYREVGVTEYIWKTSEDSIVRPDHAILDGTRQSFNNPPIVDRKTGRRANAGEDFNCRCIALAIVD